MKKVIITGGNGDIAKGIISELKINGEYEIYAPGKEEMDVTDINSVKNYINSIDPDILINNAGYIVPTTISEYDIRNDKKSIEINLFGLFNCTGAVLNKNSEAIVINIGSSAGTKARGEWSSYCAAKAGVIMATKCWADEGVKTICISPGRTATKMRKALYPNEDQNTLLTTSQFAQVVLKAIKGEYDYGTNIDVNIHNIEELLQ
ncbi:SDR family NAD(P)-dependent oxidoreductase [Sporosarcina sp. 179-K 8C2 HS]|uniref:SDR family NAD(P)-dependent oxidoreductase n=1 Tax=Sporosarcina sp. 179-K 8C2 HS TaxID=3142387 RepID=UPI0039A2E279